MSAYEVKLEVFEGPLDLLLYLIKKQDMDIVDIRISEITEEYLAYIQIMKDLNLEMAGEFLVMATTLMQIKTKMLLPQDNADAELDEIDPRAELVAKLQEYQKYKEAAKMLSMREQQASEIFYRNVMPTFSDDDMTLQATIFDLISAFKKVLKEADEDVKEMLFQEIPLEEKVREILDLLEDRDGLPFIKIFEPSRSRRELIITFLALLELIKLRQVIARQNEAFEEIWVYQALHLENAVPETPPSQN